MENEPCHSRGRLSRREFLGLGAETAGNLALSSILSPLDKILRNIEPSLPSAEAVVIEEKTAKDLVAEAMAFPVGTKERKIKESEAVTTALLNIITHLFYPRGWKEVDEILPGLSTWNARIAVLDTLWLHRQTGFFPELPKLDNRRVAWAEIHKIDPAILAYACQTRETARRILLSRFPDETDTDRLMISEGGIAAAVMTETAMAGSDGRIRGFVNIGTGSAFDQINPQVFPGAREDLIWIAERLARQTGLPFDANSSRNIPGSERGNEKENSSGGAIAWQMIPTHIKTLWWEENKERGILAPNPFHPTSLPFIWLYLAKYNYDSTDPDKQREAIRRWNDVPSQTETIFGLDQAYQNSFPSDPTPPHFRLDRFSKND